MSAGPDAAGVAADALREYLLRLGDTSLVLAQRLCEWVGHAPEIEEDIGLANLGLDLLGQARLFYAYVVERGAPGAPAGPPAAETEDALAYGRGDREFRNLLLAEQPNGDFALTIARQFLLSQWQMLLFDALQSSSDARLREIAALAAREVRYHVRYSATWLTHLGDGTPESHARAQRALESLWRFTGELFEDDDVERQLHAAGIVPLNAELRARWLERVSSTLREATLELPTAFDGRRGGRQGLHTEHLGYLLAEMQSLARAHPDARW